MVATTLGDHWRCQGVGNQNYNLPRAWGPGTWGQEHMDSLTRAVSPPGWAWSPAQ